MPKAIEFKKWLRREVIPAIREDGAYTLESLQTSQKDNKNIKNKSDMLDVTLDDNTKKMLNKLRDTINNESGFDVDKFQRVRTTLEMIKVFKEMLDDMTDDVKYKFEFLKAICTEAGMALPIFADGDDVI